MHPGSVHSEAHLRLEFQAALLRCEGRRAGIVHDVIASRGPHRHDRQRPAHAVAREREEQVGVPESERTQRLELDDRAILRVARAVSERLRGAGPIIMLAPFGRVGDLVDVVGHRLLNERELLQRGKIARRRDQPLHAR